ncbi:MAG: biotin--[acetyl-CoA-carboxylase] ligase [Candidatus Aquicultor sp.]
MEGRSTETAVIKALKEKDGDYISGEDLAAQSSVSRAAIWKHIKSLRQKGYEIEAAPRRGYRLLSSPDELFAEEILSHLATTTFGRTIVYKDMVDSTNRYAKALAENGEEEGTVVIANEQRQGKGRLDRSWVSPPGGIWLSIILRPAILPQEASRFTLLAAVAAARAIETVGLSPEIKWPNDILIGEKKVCGILLELSAQSDRVDYLVIGLGINANNDIDTIPIDSRDHVMALATALGKKIDRRSLVAALLLELENWSEILLAGGWQEIKDEWTKRCRMLGRHITLRMLHGEVEGEFVGIDQFGALQIRLPGGDTKTFAAGDVSVKKQRLT